MASIFRMIDFNEWGSLPFVGCPAPDAFRRVAVWLDEVFGTVPLQPGSSLPSLACSKPSLGGSIFLAKRVEPQIMIHV